MMKTKLVNGKRTPFTAEDEIAQNDEEKRLLPEKKRHDALNAIHEMESQITARNIRAALLGDRVAIEKIQRIEENIALLRKGL